MALSTYSELQSAVASWLHRTDLTSQIQEFIRLAESDLQVRARLSQWDTSGTVSLTSGVGSLPSDFASAISLGYGTSYTLDSLPTAKFNGIAVIGEAGEPVYWTIRGSSLLVYPLYTGDVTLEYRARFTPLSDSATTNSLLTLFPDAYLHGALMHACDWDGNDAGLQKYGALFEGDIARVRKYIRDYKYPDTPQMRVA